MSTPFQTLRDRLEDHTAAVVEEYRRELGLAAGKRLPLAPTKSPEHGDFACTAALALAKPLKKNPREIAEALKERLVDAGGLLERIEIAGPGYLNLFVRQGAWHRALAEMVQLGSAYLESRWGAGRRINVEFVSANPTGPLHVAHGRGAVHGDIVARLLEATGHEVRREYYINDHGHQTDVMARSLYIRYLEVCGQKPEIPEEFYPGQYLVSIAEALKEVHGQAFVGKGESEWLHLFRAAGIEAMLKRIKDDLRDFGVRFDVWTSERALTEEVGLGGVIDRLAESGHVYEEEGKRWFRSTAYGDDKDRVVVREDGRSTYFASDIAYHDDKLKRGVDHLINVWGADHGGYIARVRAGMQALGHNAERLEVLLVQMVSLSRGGEAMRMGKRLGTAVWLRDVVAEAGADATRYLFAMRSTSSQMDFDLDLATQKSLDNPVYYAQMGHARLCAIARRANEAGIDEPTASPEVAAGLVLPEEIELIKKMQAAPEVVSDAARSREPHKVTHYLQSLIGDFHSYYTKYGRSEKVISDDADKTAARLLLCKGLRLCMATLLAKILGVSAPEAMYLDAEADA